jgi:hypothetical protein
MKTKLICLAILLSVCGAAQSNAQTPPQSTNKTAEAASKTNQTWGFTFSGGTPRDFVAAIDKYYKTDWLTIAQIPDEMQHVQIPRMRLPASVPLKVPTSAAFDTQSSLLTLYAALAAKDPELGSLFVSGDPKEPSLVIFIPDKSAPKSDIKVKAFSLQNLPQEKLPALIKEIDRTQNDALNNPDSPAGRNLRAFDGRTKIHADTKMLVAFGADAYVTMVQSIVEAFVPKRPDLENLEIKREEPKK